MSEYDEPRRYRSVRTRVRDRDEPDYVREETYIERGKAVRGNEIAFRGRDDSVEEIPRHFPPPLREYERSFRREDDRRTRSAGGRRYEDDYEDDRYTEYTKSSHRRDRDRRSHRDDRTYYSDESRSPPRDRDRPQTGVDKLVESLGLGALVGGILGKDKEKEKSRDRDRSPYSARSGRSRSRGPRSRRSSSSRSRGGPQTERKWAQAAQAALIAGAVEAFRSRKEPGPWGGEKGKRIATAAIGAGGFDRILDRDPEKKSKRHLAEAVVGGLAVNRLANGPRSKSRGPDARNFSPDSRRSRSRSRSGLSIRSRSRSVIDRFRGRSESRGRARSVEGEEKKSTTDTIKGVLAGGAAAVGAKAIYDRVRSKSRKRRSPSNSSADSYVPSRNRRRDGRRSPPSDTRGTRQIDGATDRDRGLDRGISRAGSANNDGTNNRALVGAAGAGAAAGAIGSRDRKKLDELDDGNDSSSTTDMENKRKKMKGKELITAGLATIATIHAAHGVYSSMEAHEKRHKLVAEGEMTPEEARKKQTKAWIQDAAAVGIAALGIKGAFSEWKEMKEQRSEIREIEERKRLRRKKVRERQRQEERERHERMMAIMEKNPQLAMNYQMMQHSGMPGMTQAALNAAPSPGGLGGPPMRVDNSGNPYA